MDMNELWILALPAAAYLLTWVSTLVKDQDTWWSKALNVVAANVGKSKNR